MGNLYISGLKKLILAFAGLFFIISFVSCKKTNLIPSYIHIEKINLQTTYEIDGTNSNKIVDAWVYIDDNLQGIYELPATFPVLTTGRHTVKIRPGIKLNGIAMSRAYYPYFQPYETTIDLNAEQIDTINPTVTYVQGNIHWKEDFETAGISLVKFSNSDTNFIQTQDTTKVFQGFSSGIVTLDGTYDHLISVSNEIFEIPQDQSAVFLELNYKTNTVIRVGVYAVLGNGMYNQIETMYINANSNWNKIYINLTPTINSSNTATGFKIFFEAYKPDNLSSCEILLDNIKLLYSE